MTADRRRELPLYERTTPRARSSGEIEEPASKEGVLRLNYGPLVVFTTLRATPRVSTSERREPEHGGMKLPYGIWQSGPVKEELLPTVLRNEAEGGKEE